MLPTVPVTMCSVERSHHILVATLDVLGESFRVPSCDSLSFCTLYLRINSVKDSDDSSKRPLSETTSKPDRSLECRITDANRRSKSRTMERERALSLERASILCFLPT